MTQLLFHFLPCKELDGICNSFSTCLWDRRTMKTIVALFYTHRQKMVRSIEKYVVLSFIRKQIEEKRLLALEVVFLSVKKSGDQGCHGGNDCHVRGGDFPSGIAKVVKITEAECCVVIIVPEMEQNSAWLFCIKDCWFDYYLLMSSSAMSLKTYWASLTSWAAGLQPS